MKIDDFLQADRYTMDRKIAVVKAMIELFGKMIFEKKRFHGDPHPGNVYVKEIQEGNSQSDPTKDEILLIDWGSVVELAPVEVSLLRKLLRSINQEPSPQDKENIVNKFADVFGFEYTANTN